MLLDSLNGRQYIFRCFFVILFFAVGAVHSDAVSAKPIKIVALGDSLTAGYGLASQDAYPARLQAALQAKGFDVVITNAGVSGDTTNAGLLRVDWSVSDDTDIVILGLGANDALRGIDPSETRKSLSAIVARLREKGIRVLLTGMLAPPNLGADYGKQFEAIYVDLGALEGVTLYKFFLEGVAGRADLNQPDGLHPTAKGTEEIVKRLVPVVIPLLK